MDYLVVLLGGRVTEHLIFGQITTGASDDLKKVHEISRSMVTDYGMGTEPQSQAAARRRLLDVGCHPPPDRRGAAVHRRPGPPPRAADGRRAPRRCSRPSPSTLLDNEVLEREDIERLVAEHEGAQPQPPRLEPLERQPRCGVAAAKRLESEDAEPTSTPAPCSARSTTSESPSRTSTRRSPSTGTGSAWPSSTARPSRSSGVQARPARDRRLARRAAHPDRPGHRRGPVPRARTARACTTWPTGRTTSTPRSSACARRAPADRRAAAHRDPGQPRGLRAPKVHRRRAHRDGSTSGGTLDG